MATMADAAGALTTLGFIQTQGGVNPSGPFVKNISQPGIAGIALRREGYAGEPFSLRTIAAFANSGDAATAQILYTNYRSRNVTFTDDQGNAWANLFVLAVRVVDVKRIHNGVGSLYGKSYLVEAEWTLQSGAIQY